MWILWWASGMGLIKWSRRFLPTQLHHYPTSSTTTSWDKMSNHCLRWTIWWSWQTWWVSKHKLNCPRPTHSWSPSRSWRNKISALPRHAVHHPSHYFEETVACPWRQSRCSTPTAALTKIHSTTTTHPSKGFNLSWLAIIQHSCRRRIH